jgi:hypothetical protein
MEAELSSHAPFSFSFSYPPLAINKGMQNTDAALIHREGVLHHA